jgi:hypothetical protein
MDGKTAAERLALCKAERQALRDIDELKEWPASYRELKELGLDVTKPWLNKSEKRKVCARREAASALRNAQAAKQWEDNDE